MVNTSVEDSSTHHYSPVSKHPVATPLSRNIAKRDDPVTKENKINLPWYCNDYRQM